MQTPASYYEYGPSEWETSPIVSKLIGEWSSAKRDLLAISSVNIGAARHRSAKVDDRLELAIADADRSSRLSSNDARPYSLPLLFYALFRVNICTKIKLFLS